MSHKLRQRRLSQGDDPSASHESPAWCCGRRSRAHCRADRREERPRAFEDRASGRLSTPGGVTRAAARAVEPRAVRRRAPRGQRAWQPDRAASRRGARPWTPSSAAQSRREASLAEGPALAEVDRDRRESGPAGGALDEAGGRMRTPPRAARAGPDRKAPACPSPEAAWTAPPRGYGAGEPCDLLSDSNFYTAFVGTVRRRPLLAPPARWRRGRLDAVLHAPVRPSTRQGRRPWSRESTTHPTSSRVGVELSRFRRAPPPVRESQRTRPALLVRLSAVAASRETTCSKTPASPTPRPRAAPTMREVPRGTASGCASSPLRPASRTNLQPVAFVARTRVRARQIPAQGHAARRPRHEEMIQSWRVLEGSPDRQLGGAR
jgi:hypothetical protein